MTAAYRKFGLGNLVLLLALAWAGPGMALERLRLSLVGATPEEGAQLEPALKATSTLFSARRDGRTDPQDLISAALADYAGLVEVLYGTGHYGGTVSIRIDGQEAARIPPLSPPPRIEQVDITIDPGPRFRFGEVRIAPRAPGSALSEDARRGEPARAAALRGAIRQAVGDWRATGHAKTRIAAQQVTADHPSARLSARIRLAPGPRLRFGRLVVTPGSAVRAERIRAIAGLPEGTVFTPDAVETAAKRLRSTSAFRSVVLREADAPRADDRLDITATVVDEKPRRIGAGAELSSLEGLRLSSYWVHRNLMGGAERLRLEGVIGGIGGESGGADIELGVRLDKPAILGPDTGLFLHADAEDLHEPEYTTREVSLGGGITRRFSDTLSGELGLDVSYSEVNDALGRRNFTLVSLPGTLLWDRRDDTLSPKAGTYLSLEAEPFVRVSGGSGAGARLVADARAYRAFGARDRTVLAGRLQLGTVVGPALDDTPPRMQFYSGGGGTVRGQPYQSLGVPQAGGGQTGGRSFAGVSAELRLGLSGKIGVVGFADAGYIGADGSFAGSGDWHAGAGLGLRYDTPVGPLRLDLAAPVEGRTGDGMQIYIGIGQAF